MKPTFTTVKICLQFTCYHDILLVKSEIHWQNVFVELQVFNLGVPCFVDLVYFQLLVSLRLYQCNKLHLEANVGF